MNAQNIYTSLNEILKDNTTPSNLRNQLVSLTSNIRVSMNNSCCSKGITIKTICPTCGSTINKPNTNNTTTNTINNTITNNSVKKALLIGINYIGTVNALNGCINDCNNIKNTLISKYGFNNDNIQLITDNTSIKPNKATIISELTKLLTNSKSGDTLVFAYSGHGTNIKDRNKDEWDGYDEMLVPLDLNLISDDELSNIIRTNLKSNVNLFMLFDCCFSESIMDLRYQYLDTMKGSKTIINNNYNELLGNLVCISGCQDNQTSADAYINGSYNGALTWSFLQSINSNSKPNWINLLTNMRILLKNNGYSQIAQMSSGKLLNNTAQLFL